MVACRRPRASSLRSLTPCPAELKRKDNPFRRKQIAKHKAGTDDTAGPSAAKKPRLQMPDEYLPPNPVLFIQNLPDGTTQEDLREVFEQYPGLVEIRTIAAKKDIAFVEFEGEDTATVAKDALHNFKIDGETKMKVGFDCGWGADDAGDVCAQVDGCRHCMFEDEQRGDATDRLAAASDQHEVVLNSSRRVCVSCVERPQRGIVPRTSLAWPCNPLIWRSTDPNDD